MASSCEGSSTITFWKRRSRALSCSKYFWNSSSVVAPMVRSSPRARAGLRMLAASIAPDDLPAPTSVWISSMKSRISPSLAVTSCTTAFRRSSNSPWYLAPAIRAPHVERVDRLRFQVLGHVAVDDTPGDTLGDGRLPTPASPTRIGLFFVRRERICSTRRISLVTPDDRVEICRSGPVRSG